MLSGILNGIDTLAWNPMSDPALAVHYGATSLARKRANKIALQAETGLDADPEQTLLAFIGRLAEQKGIDLLLEALPEPAVGPGTGRSARQRGASLPGRTGAAGRQVSGPGCVAHRL